MGRTILTAAVLAAMVAFPLESTAQSSFPDFSAKRVTPPKPGAKRRITVQVAPRANPAVPPLPNATAPAGTAVATVAPVAPASPSDAVGAYAWFWQVVSPARADSGPGRLAPALVQLAQSPSGNAVRAPRLQHLQDIAAVHGVDLLRETVGTRVSPALALAVIAVESAGQADAQSGAGAQGLMQLMPATAERFGVDDAFDPQQNIRGGVRFLDHLMEAYNGDPILVLAAYNAGEGSVRDNDGVPPYPETRDYVPKVLAAFQVARGLCLTPPELVSDGCVFQVAAR